MAFSYYKSVTLAESQSGTADSTDWPLTISLDGNVQAADADLKTVGNGGFVQNANGYDIRPYSDSGLTSALTYELVYYDATNGKLEMHVKIPTLSTSTDTVIYLAFGDSGISTDGSSTSTWNTAFVLVNHFKDGTTLSVADSSQSAQSVANNSATAGAGQIDGAANIGSTSNSVQVTAAASLDITGDITLSGWIKIPSADSAKYPGMFVKSNGVNNWDYAMYVGGPTAPGGVTNIIGFYSDGLTPKPAYIATSGISLDTWIYVVITHVSGGNTIAYLDGAQNGTPISQTGGIGALGYDLYLGRDRADPGAGFTGSLDEIRVSNVVRAPSWITAEYNAQKTSSTFITWGTKTAVGGGAPTDHGEGYTIIT